MDNLPQDPDGFEPTPEDWAEYCRWAAEFEARHDRTEACEAHNWQDPATPCPECEAEWESTWPMGEGPDSDPTPDWWYTDLLMQASHGSYDPHHGWRSEQ